MQRTNFRGQLRTAVLAALTAILVLPISAGATETDPDGYSFKYSNGLQFKRNDGMFKIKLGGRIMADFASISQDSGLGMNPAFFPPLGDGGGQGVEFRRARIYMSGDLYDRIIFKAQYDFASGPVNFKDVYIGMKNLGPVGTVRVGHMKEPFSLEELTSSKYITFMERPLPSAFDAERNFGIAANNAILDKRATWALGIFAPSNDQGKFFSPNSNLNITGRMTGLPLYEEEGRKLVHLGFAVSRQVRDGASQSFSVRPEVHLAQKYLQTGTFMSDGNTLIDAEFALVCGPFSLQSEFQQGWYEVMGGPTSSLYGTYVQASWFATGEHRAYKTSTGVFDRTSPNNPFDPGKGDWGALELAVRYSYLDLNDKTILGGDEQNVTLGVNWYLYSNVRMMFNYVYADVKSTGAATPPFSSGSVNTFQARAQLEF